MSWRLIGALLFGAAFQIVNFVVLFLTDAWLRFSRYEAQVLAGSGNFLIPVGTAGVGLDSTDAWVDRAIPYSVVLLLLVSSACLFAHVRLAK